MNGKQRIITEYAEKVKDGTVTVGDDLRITLVNELLNITTELAIEREDYRNYIGLLINSEEQATKESIDKAIETSKKIEGLQEDIDRITEIRLTLEV